MWQSGLSLEAASKVNDVCSLEVEEVAVSMPDAGRGGGGQREARKRTTTVGGGFRLVKCDVRLLLDQALF